MKPLGQKPCRFPHKIDYHPPKGWINWWEDQMSTFENKGGARQQAKRDIQRELQDYYQ